MQVKVNHLEWRVLRAVLRGKGEYGDKLRLEMTRRTRDGRFLTALVEQGLLEIIETGNTPFENFYRTTDLGKKAAEYGEYDLTWEEYKRLFPNGSSACLTHAKKPAKRGRKKHSTKKVPTN